MKEASLGDSIVGKRQLCEVLQSTRRGLEQEREFFPHDVAARPDLRASLGKTSLALVQIFWH